jgi:N-succinyldiaminopimelate aminotransferase
MTLRANPLFAGLPTTIFELMSGLAREHGAVNLGQGFPDSEGPEDVRAAAARATLEGPNQYPPMLGTPALRQAVADHYTRTQGLSLAAEQVVITAGATEALAAAFLALVSPGDEVVLFQPLYDSYAPMVRRAGGVPRFVTLQAPDWRLTEAALDQAFGPNTRLVVFNNPHNPAAVVYPQEDLELLADYCRRYDCIAVCDEVWEEVVFDGRAHLPLMALPGMAERTVKIGSAGKIFSLTGWKVGWLVAAPEIAAVLARAHQFLTFTVAPNLQAAVAYGLNRLGEPLETMRRDFARSRDRLANGLRDIGFVPLPSAGTYFLIVDLRASGIGLDDRSFCLRAVEAAGVAAIPVSAFYEEAPETGLIRLCFAKRDETLDRGLEGLERSRRLLSA